MNAERHCLNAECGTRNAERPHSANAPLTRKDYISAERGVRNAERPHSANAPLTRKDYISALRVTSTRSLSLAFLIVALLPKLGLLVPLQQRLSIGDATSRVAYLGLDIGRLQY